MLYAKNHHPDYPTLYDICECRDAALKNPPYSYGEEYGKFQLQA